MDKNTQLWNQYELFRQELRGGESLNHQLMGILIGATGVLLTTGFSQDDPFVRGLIFLCVYVITIPGYRLLQGNRRRIWRISTYMRVFIEPYLKFVKWETRLSAQRSNINKLKEKQSLGSLVGTNEWMIIFMLNLVATLSSIFYGLLLTNLDIQLKVGIITSILVFNFWLYLNSSRQEKELRRNGKVEKDFIQSWLEVKKQEK